MRLLVRAAWLLLMVGGCSRHFVEIQRTVSNDPALVRAQVLVVEVEADPADFAELAVSTRSGQVLRSGQVPLDSEVVAAAVAETLSFDGKSVLTRAEYERIRSGLQTLRPTSGFRSPDIEALIRLRVQVGLQTGAFEQEGVLGFYRRASRCQYLKNPPPKYQACQKTEDSAWDEIRVTSGATGKVSLSYSGAIFLNEADEFRLHRSLSGSGVLETPYEDEAALAQKVAGGLGRLLANELGTLALKLRLEIDEGNHSEAIDLLKAGKLEEARTVLEQAVQDPLFESSTDLYNLGLIYHAYGDRVVAADYYGKAIAAGGYKRLYVDALRNLKALDAETTLD